MDILLAWIFNFLISLAHNAQLFKASITAKQRIIILSLDKLLFFNVCHLNCMNLSSHHICFCQAPSSFQIKLQVGFSHT